MTSLAFSDIHHNLEAVRKLRASEANSFDAVVVAGDIGSESANKFFKILSTFNCPVLYVFGNGDHELLQQALRRQMPPCPFKRRDNWGPSFHRFQRMLDQLGQEPDRTQNPSPR
jgi:predicted phosphodiesterase